MNTVQLNLFSVPVIHYEDFLPLELVQDIKNYVLTRTDTVAPHFAISKPGVSTHHNFSLDIIREITSSVEGCTQFYNNIMTCVDDYTTKTGLPKTVLTNSWFNIQQPGSVLRRHMHAGGYAVVAGALYINVDDKSSPLVFENPNPYCLLNTRNQMDQITIKPTSGDLILFPSWLVHSSVEPNMTENRIVISFNTNSNT